jgi:hypothetical protein
MAVAFFIYDLTKEQEQLLKGDFSLTVVQLRTTHFWDVMHYMLIAGSTDATQYPRRAKTTTVTFNFMLIVRCLI